jgi:flagellar biosynthesis/type III secretory pathway ATPase
VIATFGQEGHYRLRCTIINANGDSAATDVSVEVQQTAMSLKVEPHRVRIAIDATEQFTGTVLDQFGHPMQTPQTLTYVVVSGAGSISSTGLFSATSIAGPVTIEVEADDLTSTVGAVVG